MSASTHKQHLPAYLPRRMTCRGGGSHRFDIGRASQGLSSNVLSRRPGFYAIWPGLFFNSNPLTLCGGSPACVPSRAGQRRVSAFLSSLSAPRHQFHSAPDHRHSHNDFVKPLHPIPLSSIHVSDEDQPRGNGLLNGKIKFQEFGNVF